MPNVTILVFIMEPIAPAHLEAEEAIAPYPCVEEHCMMGQDDLLSPRRMGLSTETYQLVLAQMDGLVLLATVSPQHCASLYAPILFITVCSSSSACNSAYTSSQPANIGASLTGGDTGAISVSPHA